MIVQEDHAVSFGWVDWRDVQLAETDLDGMIEWCRSTMPGRWRMRIHNATGRNDGALSYDPATQEDAVAEVTFFFRRPADREQFTARFVSQAPILTFTHARRSVRSVRTASRPAAGRSA